MTLDPAADRAARYFIGIGLALMCTVVGGITWLSLARPGGSFRFSFGPDVFLFVVGAGLSNRNQWALSVARVLPLLFIIIGAIGIPWNIVIGTSFGLAMHWTILGAGVCAVAVLIGIALRRTVRLIDGDPSKWTGKGLPKWAWLVIGLYVTLAIGAVALFMRSFMMG